MHTYQCFYEGKKIGIEATCLLNAHRAAVKKFGAKEPWRVITQLKPVSKLTMVAPMTGDIEDVDTSGDKQPTLI